MRRLPYLLPPLSVLLMFLACGGRTGLLGAEEGAEAPIDAAADHVVFHDAAMERDAEAEADVPNEATFRDVPVVDMCPDAGATLIYLLTEGNALYSFYPPTLAFTEIGLIDCPGDTTPFSMAVDRRGIAYSVFQDGRLFRLDTASAACEATKFMPGQSGFKTFGMGFVANSGDAGETLFVAEATAGVGKPNSLGLATVDTASFDLGFVGAFAPPIPGPELTGTADGTLYAFFTNATGSGSQIVQVDKTSGNILETYALQVGAPDDAYAFAFYGGVFWVFTSEGTTTQVTRFDPATSSEMLVSNLAAVVVGAGVSTCAPM
jgi:hypothetical protein